MKRILFGVLAVVLAAISRGAFAEEPLPQIPLIKSAIKVDGTFDEAAWQTAPVFKIDNFCHKKRRDAGEKPKETTVVRVLRDEYNLYFGFTCQEPSSEG